MSSVSNYSLPSLNAQTDVAPVWYWLSVVTSQPRGIEHSHNMHTLTNVYMNMLSYIAIHYVHAYIHMYIHYTCTYTHKLCVSKTDDYKLTTL